jgi:hypothetical protein
VVVDCIIFLFSLMQVGNSDKWKGFIRSRHNRLLLAFLFVFVGPTERCCFENFGSLWCTIAANFPICWNKRNI